MPLAGRDGPYDVYRLAIRIMLQSKDTHAAVTIRIILYGRRGRDSGDDLANENSIVLQLIKPML